MRIVNASGYLVEREHLDIRPTLVTILQPDNQEFTPDTTDNWSRLAWRKLGNGRRWWIIADYSKIIDPFGELAAFQVLSAVSQLSANVAAATVTQITLTDVRRILRGQRLRVESLDPALPNTFDCSVLAVNATTKVVNITPATSPGVLAALSRVSIIKNQGVKLTCPSVHRAFFEILDFNNPLNTLVDG